MYASGANHYRFKDLSGQRCGSFVVIRMVRRNARESKWLCQCDCGNTKELAYPKRRAYCPCNDSHDGRMKALDSHGFVPLTIRASRAVVHISRGRIAIVDVSDWRSVACYRWTYDHRKTVDYAMRRQGGRTIRMHVQIMGTYVDHKNRNGLDNRRSNLRPCDRYQNGCNRKNKIGKFGIGAYRNGPGYSSEIVVRGEKVRLGTFPTAEEARNAYDIAARKHHGEFATTNAGRNFSGHSPVNIS